MDTFDGIDTFSFEYKDKIVHATFYFVFTIFWCLFFRTRMKGNVRLKVFLIAVSYGVLIEICQALFTEQRSGDVADALANTAGSAIAILVLWLFEKIRK